MKNIYQIFCLLFVVATTFAMEKRKGDDQEPGGAKRPRVLEVPEPRVTGFADLPADVRGIILNLLVNAPGRTNGARLQAAAESIRNFMTLNRVMRGYLENDIINGYLIGELAQRYTNGNLLDATLALHTAAGGRWFTNWLRMQGSLAIDKTFDHAKSVLGQAAGSGDLATVSFILRFIPGIVGYNINIALTNAIEHGHMAVVDRLLAILDIDANELDDIGRAPLVTAARFGNIPIIERLLAAGADINFQDSVGFTPLMAAVLQGNIHVVQRLLQVQGINLNSVDDLGYSALTYALHERNPNKAQIIQLLQDRGALEHNPDAE
jgi:hypothetical protein